MAALPVVHSPEILTGGDRPVHRAGLNAQFFLNFFHQIKRVLGVPVHFIDEGKNGNVTHNADLKQFPGLVFHAFAGVDDHHGGVRCHQSAVSVFRKVLVAGGIQDVDAVTFVLKLHHRAGDRNTTLLFNLHPVTDCMAGIFLSLYRASQSNGAAIKQKLFG